MPKSVALIKFHVPLTIDANDKEAVDKELAIQHDIFDDVAKRLGAHLKIEIIPDHTEEHHA